MMALPLIPVGIALGTGVIGGGFAGAKFLGTDEKETYNYNTQFQTTTQNYSNVTNITAEPDSTVRGIAVESRPDIRNEPTQTVEQDQSGNGQEGFSTPFIVGSLAVAGGLAYWYFT